MGMGIGCATGAGSGASKPGRESESERDVAGGGVEELPSGARPPRRPAQPGGRRAAGARRRTA